MATIAFTKNNQEICVVSICENPVHHRSSGYCLKHYACWKRTGDPIARIKPTRGKTCSAPDCKRPHRRRGFCEMHSARMSRHGDLNTHFATKYSSDTERRQAIKVSKRKYRFTENGKLAGRLKRQRRRSKKLDDIRLTTSQMNLLLTIFDDQCFRCKTTKDLTFDHHVPLIHGGKLDLFNTVVLCRSCNGKKWKFQPHEFYSEVELSALKQIMQKLREKLSAMPQIVLLYGVHGVGKTTLAKSLGDIYHVVHSDSWKNKNELMAMLFNSLNNHLDKPLLVETPRSVTAYLTKLTERFLVDLVFLDESTEVITERLSNRGGIFSDAIKHSQKTMQRYHRRYGGFRGTYSECADYLKLRLPPRVSTNSSMN